MEGRSTVSRPHGEQGERTLDKVPDAAESVSCEATSASSRAGQARQGVGVVVPAVTRASPAYTRERIKLVSVV